MRYAGLALAALLSLGFARTEERAPCERHDPLRQPFYGELHVHTAFSFDGWGQGTRATPRAKRYASRGVARVPWPKPSNENAVWTCSSP